LRTIFIALLMVAPGFLHAGVIFDVAGISDPTLMSTVEFSYSPGTGIIDIAIHNTSLVPPNSDPRVTSFAFNVPDNVTGLSAFTGPADWAGWFDRDNMNTPNQLGLFDLAGLTGANFNGGSPNDGIPASSTFDFQFVLSGSNLGLLTEASFLGLPSAEEAGGGTAPQYFAVRFQRTGPNGDRSDVGIPTSVPEPSTLVSLGVALAGVAWLRRRSKPAVQ